MLLLRPAFGAEFHAGVQRAGDSSKRGGLEFVLIAVAATVAEELELKARVCA